MCGEKLQQHGPGWWPWGSPPRVRGKVFSEGLLPVIPGDHPRVCGEKSGLMRSNATGTGSPPRVRGKDVSGADATPWIRITPACAGKSFTSMKCFRAIQDHPRVCGEKTEIAYVVFLSEGSPPRVRGKAYRIKPHCVNARITPACAGKSKGCCGVGIPLEDHPRVCGEKQAEQDLIATRQGSPPRVRGKVPFPVLHGFGAGITPACAGKRLKRSHSIGHFSCILCLFHSVLHRASVSGGSRAGPCAPPCLPAQNAVPV